ncbi:ABC transporter permease [Pseudidiomarina taiwanensis]|uniref:ABC transporter permease n=1 Tax=Pseudidiomarina taiwanensis TaxID=337250 RepID=A0A432ZNH9_9GAMM|nr:ABC transporter permease [Pseudidiomarina taiwanensis]RUO79437.1 ABC transporter permease [Pseudidiomarina taiwanensis]
MRYTLQRLLLLLITLVLLSLFTFSLNYFFPGDVLTNMTGIRAIDANQYASVALERDINASFPQQYITYLGHILSGQWGQSLITQEDVFQTMTPLLGASLELIVLTMLLSMLLGAPLGIYAALTEGGSFDRIITGLGLSSYSIPVFWLAQMLILFFAVKLGIAPISGQINPLYDVPVTSGAVLIDIWLNDYPYPYAALLDALNHLWLPIIVLSIMPMTMLIRITRGAVLDVLRQNYIRAARARGLKGSTILTRHVLPNAMQQVVGQLGLLFSLLMSNIIIVEVIFNWPGIGSWLVKSIYERDYPILQAGVLVFATLILLVNVAVELFHAWRYPQVRKELYAE